MSDDAKTILENLDRLAEYNDGYGYPDIGDQVRDAIDLIKRLTLQWSSERPTLPGRYLVRYYKAGDFGWDAKLLTQADLDSGFASSIQWFKEHHFAGPLKVAEPTPEPGGQS